MTIAHSITTRSSAVRKAAQCCWVQWHICAL